MTHRFREEVQAHRWPYEVFYNRFRAAALEVAESEGDPSIAQVSVSSRSFERWMAGDLKSLPRYETGRVLEHLLGIPLKVLFARADDAASGVDEQPPPMSGGDPAAAELVPGRTGAPDPALVPHWATLLRILAEAHNAIGSAHVHRSAVTEMTLIRGARRQARGHLLRSLLGIEARWAEFASWTAETLGASEDSAYWLDRSLHLAREATDGTMTAYTLMRQAQSAIERRDAATAKRLAGLAVRNGEGAPRDRALSALRLAQALALSGDAHGSENALRAASRLVDEADELGLDDDPATIGQHCRQAYVQAHRGHCLLLLGCHDHAVRTLEETLGSWPQELRQDEYLTRAWLALAYAGSGRVCEAAATGADLLSTARGSTRVLRHLRQLDRSLASHPGSAAEVAAFRTAMATSAPRM
ncbi:hypothetical protein [Kitasatospora sp. NPDC088783]|uniref:hypothetical protein n=1 Tax=Kitasatospora sp. NPDC088783 TaxID=3364077 RepID=UPI0037F10678